MSSTLVGARDKPHWSAAVGPICGGLVLAACLAAAAPLPASRAASAEHPIAAPTPGPLGWLWDAATLALPVGERGVRGEIGALLLVLAGAGAAGLLAWNLYRGTGRSAAAFASVPVCAALLTGWLQAAPVDAPAILGSTLLATAALAMVVGKRTGTATIAAGATALAAALLWPRAGFGVLALVLGYVGWTAPGAIWRRAVIGLGLAALPILLVFGTGRSGHVLADSWWNLPRLEQLGVMTGSAELIRWTGPMLYPALALLVLLVLPLRWRGGGLLLALAVMGSTLADRSGAVVPAPMVLVVIAVGACGWIWLAGSVRWPRAAPVCAWAAALVVLAGTATMVRPATEPVAARRPEASLLALHQRGLVAPGDVLLAHDPWLAAAFAAAQRDEGLRPDIEVHAATRLDPARLSDRLAGWARAGRRVLSDSFSYGGRWQPTWTLDSGPLFWFAGTAATGEREFTDLGGLGPAPDDPRISAVEQARWERMHVERARHRRALGRHAEALLALPLDDATLAPLAQQLRLAELSRLPAAEGSELGPAAWTRAASPASSLAEAGDLLLALGDGATGSARLAEAADRGVAEAFGALVRWQLRAGEEEAARATLSAVAAAPVLRPQLLAVCRWLLGRARPEQAASLLAGVERAPGHAAEELGVRLATLRELAGP
jgi:hypothetical protein